MQHSGKMWGRSIGAARIQQPVWPGTGRERGREGRDTLASCATSYAASHAASRTASRAASVAKLLIDTRDPGHGTSLEATQRGENTVDFGVFRNVLERSPGGPVGRLEPPAGGCLAR